MLELHKDALFHSIVEEIINGVDMDGSMIRGQIITR
jgi:hypothetical protein